MRDGAIDLLVDPDPSVLEPIHQALDAYNESQVGATKKETFAVSSRGDDGTIVGGGIAILQGGWLFIDTLWVAESHRRRGLGSALLARLEETAVQHGVRRARLNTTDFQAPSFYERRGYAVFAEIPLLLGPTGAREVRFFWMKKRL